MKKITVILFMWTFFATIESSAQKQKELDKVLKDNFWTYCPKEFKVTKEPEIWKNESAVIMASAYEYTVGKEIRGLKTWAILKHSVHFRIKLMDKASIEEYSELNFNNNRVSSRAFGGTTSYRYVGIKIVKANGTEKELDLTKSVTADYNSSSDNKIAVPDLEPGDILDYFITSKNEYDAALMSYNDIIETELLENKYPTVYRSLYYVLPSSYSIYDYSYNGAPKFSTDRSPDDVAFKFVDTMRAKAPDILWNYPYRTSPEIRYRLSRSNSYDYKDNMKFNNYAYMEGLAYVEDFMNKNFKKSTDTLLILQELFLMLRSPIYLNQFSKGYPLYEPMNYAGIGKNIALFISDYLSKKKIAHDVLIAPKRNTGPFEKQIDFSACEYMIRIKKPRLMYFAVPIPFRLPNDVPYLLEGMEAAVYKFEQRLEYSNMPSEVIRVSKPEDNQTLIRLNLSLAEGDFSKMIVKRGSLIRGNNKQYHQYLIYTNYDYLKEYDKPKYEQHSSVAMGTVVAQFKKEREKFEQRAAQDYLERDKKMLESVESEMGVKVSDYKNLLVKSIGMWPESPLTEYSDEFTIDNMVKKVGQNYILDFGKLMEKQTEVKDEDRIRKVDIYMNYPRAYDDEYIFTLPEGYTVEGLENFNKYAINKTGGFISSAVVQDGKLIVKTRKYFNENYYPANKWTELLKFLDASVEFYNAKLLLRKN